MKRRFNSLEKLLSEEEGLFEAKKVKKNKEPTIVRDLKKRKALVKLVEQLFIFDACNLDTCKKSEAYCSYQKVFGVARQKMENTEKNRQKIASIRSKKKNKNKDPVVTIFNDKDLQKFVTENTPTPAQMPSLDPDRVFVCGHDFTNENMTIILSTKNLLDNYFKQGQTSEKFLCIDGTYRLNDLRYPSIILGTVDFDRKFHLGKINIFL